MNNNRKHLAVGLFVIISTAIAVSVWLWFSANSRQSYNTYLAVFTEPVDGVSTNSVVKYNGVEVGRVKKIELDSENQHNIFVYLNVLQSVAVHVQTYASIKAQGITGLSYINLSIPKDVKDGKILTPHNKLPYPRIQTRASLLYSLTEQAQSIGNNVNEVSAQMKFLLDKKNLEHVAKTLSNLDKISNTIASRSEVIGKSLDTMLDILRNVKSNTDNLNTTFQEIHQLTKTLSQTAKGTTGLIKNFENNTLQNFNMVLLPNINSTIVNLNQSSYHLEQLLILLNQNPSVLIRGKLPARPGPGE
jgi:phospholipid/cholesterol/gamma-HCH transport system substrate-binding protein